MDIPPSKCTRIARAVVEAIAGRRLWIVAAAALVGAGAAPPPEKPLVVFFGGYRSTQADMNAWASAARRSRGQSFDFLAIAYPANTSFVEREAVLANNVVIDAIAGQIKATPNRTFVVVGHSSGGGVAAAVVQEAGGGRKNVRLIVLDDGIANNFKPPPGFDTARQVECWSAVSGSLGSLDRVPTRASCKNYHEMRASSCRTPFCLHFALVNLNAPPDLNKDTAFVVAPNGTTGGYRNLRVNLSWLDSSAGM